MSELTFEVPEGAGVTGLGSDPFLQGLLEPCMPVAVSGLTGFLVLYVCASQAYSHTDDVELFFFSELKLMAVATDLVTRPECMDTGHWDLVKDT